MQIITHNKISLVFKIYNHEKKTFQEKTFILDQFGGTDSAEELFKINVLKKIQKDLESVGEFKIIKVKQTEVKKGLPENDNKSLKTFNPNRIHRKSRFLQITYKLVLGNNVEDFLILGYEKSSSLKYYTVDKTGKIKRSCNYDATNEKKEPQTTDNNNPKPKSKENPVSVSPSALEPLFQNNQNVKKLDRNPNPDIKVPEKPVSGIKTIPDGVKLLSNASQIETTIQQKGGSSKELLKHLEQQLKELTNKIK